MSEPLEPTYRAQLQAALAAAGVYLEPDAIEREGGQVYLLRGPYRLGKMSAEAWALLDADVRRALCGTLAPEPQVAPRARRCEVCGGGYRKRRLAPLTRQPCTSPYHRASPAPESA